MPTCEGGHVTYVLTCFEHVFGGPPRIMIVFSYLLVVFIFYECSLNLLPYFSNLEHLTGK